MDIRSAIHDEDVRKGLREYYQKQLWNMEEFLISPNYLLDTLKCTDHSEKIIKNATGLRDYNLKQYPVMIKRYSEYMEILNYYD